MVLTMKGRAGKNGDASGSSLFVFGLRLLRWVNNYLRGIAGTEFKLRDDAPSPAKAS
ncbi:hypothetical protein GJ744_005680 [Endocarpon pusillum]|uniref:Uncharacterized protein n=1 Tax=Endocarpon pusillum TaxID=364733 RepID=A0A8H7E109_9EURO|nr:hypothetical protein GJ744_005680 [Endocarpon pusillum]